MSIKRNEFDWTTVYCDSTTPVFIPISPWMAAGDVEKLRVPIEMRGRVGNIQIRAAYQSTNDQRTPGGASGFGGTLSAEGFEDPSSLEDVSAAFAGDEFWRMGLLCSNTSGSNFSAARVRGSLMQVLR